jgi:hypothetical protein
MRRAADGVSHPRHHWRGPSSDPSINHTRRGNRPGRRRPRRRRPDRRSRGLVLALHPEPCLDRHALSGDHRPARPQLQRRRSRLGQLGRLPPDPGHRANPALRWDHDNDVGPVLMGAGRPVAVARRGRLRPRLQPDLPVRPVLHRRAARLLRPGHRHPQRIAGQRPHQRLPLLARRPEVHGLGLRGQIQYRTPDTSTWRALKEVYSYSNGTYSYAYTTSAARYYRVVLYDASNKTIWGSTSPQAYR